MTDSRECQFTGSTKVLAVFGFPVEHSLSPAMHNAAIRALGLDYVYVPFRVAPESLAEAVRGIRAMSFAGVNLTIPLKQAAVDLVDGLSDEAARVGSVNTLWWDGDRLMGDSTDGRGFLRSLEAEAGGVPRTALILGAGGAARAVCFALADRGVRMVIANRTVQAAERLASEMPGAAVDVIPLERADVADALTDAELLVNCTPVGMYPKTGETPVPPDLIGPGHVVYDLIYNPPETALLAGARRMGARAVNGVKMLVHQGALSFELWTGLKPPLRVMEQAVRDGLGA